MKKLIFSAILFLGLGTMAFAQQDSVKRFRAHKQITPEQRAQRTTDALSEKLSLTADQKEKVYAINLENAQKAQAKMEARMAEMKKERAAMKADRQKHEQEITALLNPDQLKAYQDLKKERVDAMKKHWKGGRGKGQHIKKEQKEG